MKLSSFINVLWILSVTVEARIDRTSVSQECRDLSKTPEFNDDTQTYDELMCLYWLYGFTKEESEQMAAQTLKEGDFDGNGVINGNENYGNPNK